jgi:hypothetical protein
MVVNAVEELLFARLKTGKGPPIGGVPLFVKGGKEGFTPAAESHGLWPWMNAPTLGRDVAPFER